MRASRLLLAISTFLACAGGFSTPNEAEDRVCASATSDEVRDLYRTYADFLARGDVEAITGLYSPDAILMGPAADSIRLGRSEIASYYTAFLQRRPTVVPIERVVRTDCSAIGDAGIEAVSMQHDGAARSTTLTARFSLSYGRFGDRWLIVHHHQELIDSSPRLDAPMAGAPSVRLVTGANPPSAEHVVIPPTPFELPASAPVILMGQRSLVPIPEVAAVIDYAAIERLANLALETPINIDVFIPRTTFSLGLLPPTIGSTPPIALPPAHLSLPAALPPVQPISPVAVTIPPATFALPPGPPRVEAFPVRTAIAPLRLKSSPVETQIKKPSLGAEPIKPAVAGFTQRAAPEPAPPAVARRTAAPAAALPKPPRPEPRPEARSVLKAQPQPKPAALAKPAIVAPATALPLKTGKFLRWDEQTPIFDD